jgi:hypothetical protein
MARNGVPIQQKPFRNAIAQTQSKRHCPNTIKRLLNAVAGTRRPPADAVFCDPPVGDDARGTTLSS